MAALLKCQYLSFCTILYSEDDLTMASQRYDGLVTIVYSEDGLTMAS